MTIKDLDGISHKWSLVGKIQNNRSNQSNLHKTACVLLKEIYPTLQILQEVDLPLRKNQTLYLDFYIPLLRTAVEVHGEQHYKFVSHYHTNAMGFIKHQKRDKEKKEWCEINNINYIELPFNENIEEWRGRILLK